MMMSCLRNVFVNFKCSMTRWDISSIGDWNMKSLKHRDMSQNCYFDKRLLFKSPWHEDACMHRKTWSTLIYIMYCRLFCATSPFKVFLANHKGGHIIIYNKRSDIKFRSLYSTLGGRATHVCFNGLCHRCFRHYLVAKPLSEPMFSCC